MINVSLSGLAFSDILKWHDEINEWQKYMNDREIQIVQLEKQTYTVKKITGKYLSIQIDNFYKNCK